MIKLLGFTKSSNPKKKYDAYLLHNGKIKKVPFGDTAYQQYQDKALGLYKYLDHLDKDRRIRYKLRHEQDRHIKYSAGWFSDKYLW